MENLKLDRSVYISIAFYGEKVTNAFSFTAVNKDGEVVLEQQLIEFSMCCDSNEFLETYNYFFIKFVGKYRCRVVLSATDEDVFYNKTLKCHEVLYVTVDTFESIIMSNFLNNHISNSILITDAISKNGKNIIDNEIIKDAIFDKGLKIPIQIVN